MTAVQFQFNGKQVNVADVERKAKDIWKEHGGLVKNLKDLEIYVVAEQSKAYCVANNKHKFEIDL